MKKTAIVRYIYYIYQEHIIEAKAMSSKKYKKVTFRKFFIVKLGELVA